MIAVYYILIKELINYLILFDFYFKPSSTLALNFGYQLSYLQKGYKNFPYSIEFITEAYDNMVGNYVRCRSYIEKQLLIKLKNYF